ncbi:MAG: DUF4437 domain-containing protein [Alphaproteobacteria bacterium]|nr:DUF4437 domain-containing protein [Alphaproteobacteria bacterium]
MGRPHIEFLQSQSLPWSKGLPGGARADVDAKVLSVDTTAGDCSVLVRFPAGWSRPSPEVLAVDEEFYVLDGELEINGRRYGPDTYAHLPGGYRRLTQAAPSGAVLLAFYSGRIDTAPMTASVPEPGRVVEFVDIHVGSWNADLKAMGLEAISSGSRVRLLFKDPANGDMTYLTASPAFKHETRPEHHPVAQEFYVLSGEVAGNTGLMHTGAYCYRPPGVVHGPYGTKTGALYLLRSVGGPLTTTVCDPVAYTFYPKHQPILPPEFARYRTSPEPRRPRY